MASEPRSDAFWAGKSEEWMDTVYGWTREPKAKKTPGGVEHARRQLAADGVKVSLSQLSRFRLFYRTRSNFTSCKTFRETVMESIKSEMPEATPKALAAAGDVAFLAKAMAEENTGNYIAIRKLDQDERTGETKFKVELSKLKLAARRVAVMERKMKAASTELKKLRDPKGNLTDEDRSAILNKVDQLLLGVGGKPSAGGPASQKP
jgi:hypothetical protein